MERWQWQVVEAVYVAAQGEKAEAVARLHRMELLFRKTGHVAAEITATGCRGLVQASMNNPGARQPLMRSVYLAQEQQQQQQAEEEVAATVADKCALKLSWVVVGKEFEEAMGWFRLQRTPEMAVHTFRLSQVDKILVGLGTHGRGTRLSGLLIQEAHLQVREAAREVMMMSTSIMDDGNHWPVCAVLSAYERVAEAAVKRQQLSRALDMLREALALGSSSSSVGPFLSIGVHRGWHLWAWTSEEAIRYRMGRLLVKLRPGDKIHLAEALAMFANSLQCALRDYGRAADEECRLRRANAAWWARLTIQVLKGCPPPHFAEAATCSVLEELVGPGRLGLSPISRSQDLMECLVEVVEVLEFSPPCQALVMRHMEAVRALLEFRRGPGSEEDDAWLLFRCTHTLATACGRAGDRRTAARHFMHCQDMGLEQLRAADALVDAGEVEAAVRRVQQVLSLLTAPPADESSPWPRPKMHAGLLAFAGNLLHDSGHKDAALVTLLQAWDVLTASGCSLDFITDNPAQQPRYTSSLEDETSKHGQQPPDWIDIHMLSELEENLLDIRIGRGLLFLLEEYLRSGEEAAAALELDAAVNWYHKAADVARPFKQLLALPMSHLSYRIGELQFEAGARMESLQMLSDSLRQVLSTARDTAATPGYVIKACILVHMVLAALLDGRAHGQVGGGLHLVIGELHADLIGEFEILVSLVQLSLGRALCALSKPEGIRWLEAVRDALLLEMEMDGASGRAVALPGEEFTIHGENSKLYVLQMELAEAYSKVADDSSKAAHMYELCRDMATRLDTRLHTQLCAAREWERAGDLLSAQEAVLEALEFLDPPGHASNSNSEVTMSTMLWGSPSDSSLEVRAELLCRAAELVEALWPSEPDYRHAKRNAALEALWELCRSPANNLDVYLKNRRILQGLMFLVILYQADENWAAAARLLEALAPRMKDLCEEDTFQWPWQFFQRFEALQLSHSRQYLQAAGVLKDVISSASEDIDDIDAIYSAIYSAGLLLSSARDYMYAGQHRLAAKMLNRLESMILATTWPPPGPSTYINDVDPKLFFELQLFLARAGNAMDTNRFDQQVVDWFHRTASVQEAIINDIQQRQVPVAKHHVTELAMARMAAMLSVLGYEYYAHGTVNMDIVKGFEAWIDTLDPDARAGKLCSHRVLLMVLEMETGHRELEEVVEPLRELFLLNAERQGGRGGDDDSWITNSISMASVLGHLESIHTKLGHPEKALLWAERGRMRLFMHRVHAQQHQEADPEWGPMDSTPNDYDFDRDDGKALDMLLNTRLACGPNVALLEYSYYRYLRTQKLRVYLLRISDLKLVAGSESPSIPRMEIRSITLDGTRIEQLVKDARDSIIAWPQRKGSGEAAPATKKNRHAQQQLRYLAQLHSRLVAPVLEELPDSCDTLIFVPADCLSLVPFAALYDESAGQFLIQQKQVVVAPCLRALHRCLDLQDRFFSTASTQLQQPFVAGNPFPMGLGMRQLPHAQEEAAAVAGILGVKPCLGAAVTKEAVVEALCHSSVVLLASHAIVGPKLPAGALVLRGPSSTHDPDMASSSRASNSDASNYDLALLRAIMMDPDSDEPEAALLMRGLQASVTDKSQVLTADELSGMRIRAGLVVVSACETGRGEVTPEGVLGLGRALLQAGAATTVLSLWKVDDQATKRLIIEMFKELRNGEPVGTALRKAMLKMIDEGSSISEWAPFFIFGSPTMHLRNVTTLKGKKEDERHLRNVTTLKAKKKMNGSTPELELGDGIHATSSASNKFSVQQIKGKPHLGFRDLIPGGNIKWNI